MHVSYCKSIQLNSRDFSNGECAIILMARLWRSYGENMVGLWRDLRRKYGAKIYPRVASLARIYMGFQGSCPFALGSPVAPRLTGWQDARLWGRFSVDCDTKSANRRNDQIERNRGGRARCRECSLLPCTAARAGGWRAHNPQGSLCRWCRWNDVGCDAEVQQTANTGTFV